jgi:hypothetical protein
MMKRLWSHKQHTIAVGSIPLFAIVMGLRCGNGLDPRPGATIQASVDVSLPGSRLTITAGDSVVTVEAGQRKCIRWNALDPHTGVKWSFEGSAGAGHGQNDWPLAPPKTNGWIWVDAVTSSGSAVGVTFSWIDGPCGDALLSQP